MRDQTPSATALRVAAARALHQKLDAPPIFVDPLATRILGRGGAEELEQLARNPAETMRLRTTLAVRSRVAEQAVCEAVARGVGQCVILGAGLDTFAYRHGHRNLRVFEVDHPATQRWKRALLRDAGIPEGACVHYVGMDFQNDDLGACLVAAGLEAARPAIFVWLGVIFYLERGTIERMLRAIASGCASGGELVFDYTEPFMTAVDAVRVNYAAAAARVAAVGEPWKSFFKPVELHDLLRTAGFTAIDDVDAAALDARFCTGRTDGLGVAPLLHLVRARF